MAFKSIINTPYHYDDMVEPELEMWQSRAAKVREILNEYYRK